MVINQNRTKKKIRSKPILKKGKRKEKSISLPHVTQLGAPARRIRNAAA
jgi:hypothetical protein